MAMGKVSLNKKSPKDERTIPIRCSDFKEKTKKKRNTPDQVIG